MLVAECDCGSEVPFVLEDGDTSPVAEQCECGQWFQLTVKKLYKE